MSEAAVEELVRGGRVQEVPPDPAVARAMLEEAERHLSSASLLADPDPNGAYALLYDAARKSVTAHMIASGYRVRNRPGAHETIALYAEASLARGTQAAAVRELDRMRRNRNRSEYWSRPFGRAEIDADLEHARGVVAAARANWPS